MRRFLLVALLLAVVAAPAQAQFGLPKVKIKSPLASSSDVSSPRH